MNNFIIVKEKVATSFIAADGNIRVNTDREQFFLKNEDDEIISHQYYCMIFLGDDHFAVCDLISDVNFWADYNEYDIIKGEYEATTPKMKWGVMRINRDDSGSIIPGAETMVVPYLYDRISPNNLKTATVQSDNGFSYLDLDISRSTYGQQLVPCVLNHAVEFCVKYEGFAECSIHNIVGYLPRNCKARESIQSGELLTKNQAICLSKSYLNGLAGYCLDSETIMSYFNLTGESPIQEKEAQLMKIMRPDKGE